MFPLCHNICLHGYCRSWRLVLRTLLSAASPPFLWPVFWRSALDWKNSGLPTSTQVKWSPFSIWALVFFNVNLKLLFFFDNIYHHSLFNLSFRICNTCTVLVCFGAFFLSYKFVCILSTRSYSDSSMIWLQCLQNTVNKTISTIISSPTCGKEGKRLLLSVMFEMLLIILRWLVELSILVGSELTRWKKNAVKKIMSERNLRQWKKGILLFFFSHWTPWACSGSDMKYFPASFWAFKLSSW